MASVIMRMENFLSNTLVTRLIVVLAVCCALMVVAKGSTGQHENNYDKVACNFKDGLCGWTNLNADFQWTIIRECAKRGWWFGGCKAEDHYLQLQMGNLAVNSSSTFSSVSLAARPNVRCQLSFFYYCNCDSDSCQLSVELQTATGVTELWNVSHFSRDGDIANVKVPCSDEPYEILIVGRKLQSTGVHHMDIEDIKFNVSTLPTTSEGITSLSRRVSLTSPITLPETTPTQTLTSEKPLQSTEPMVQADQQTGNDGLTTGSVAAIAVVAVLLVIVIVIIAVIVVRRRNAAEKNQRTSGSDSSPSPVSARGNNRGHDNPVYSVTGYELNTMRELTTGDEGPDISPDYYNATGHNSAQPAAPTQDGVYVNTASQPHPQDEYAVPDKSGQKKVKQRSQQPGDEYAIPDKSGQKEMNQGSQKPEDEYGIPDKSGQKKMKQGSQQREDEYALPDKSGQKKMMRENPKPEDDYALPDKGQNKKQKQAEQDRKKKKENRNRKKKGKKREEAPAAGATDYENVGDNSAGRLSPPSSSSLPDPPEDTYNELGCRERTGVPVGEPPLNHYDRINATDNG